MDMFSRVFIFTFGSGLSLWGFYVFILATREFKSARFIDRTIKRLGTFILAILFGVLLLLIGLSFIFSAIYNLDMGEGH
ncbi:MAG: hypothetical protein ACW99Q_17150 [Candidatus Kariarchaeaceae archaeon]